MRWTLLLTVVWSDLEKLLDRIGGARPRRLRSVSWCAQPLSILILYSLEVCLCPGSLLFQFLRSPIPIIIVYRPRAAECPLLPPRYPHQVAF